MKIPMEPYSGSLTILGINLHGAQCLVTYGEEEGFKHYAQDSACGTRPRVEIFPDGVRVGCSFIAVNALRKMFEEHRAFTVERGKVIQP